MIIKKYIPLIFLVFITVTNYCSAYEAIVHKHNESSYNHAWCSMHKGIEEFQNNDFTRVDCLTDCNAVEFDFAPKWAEGIGQALHYQRMTGKRGKVVLILENPQKEMVYYYRVLELAKIYDFDVEYVTNDILKIDKNGKCFNMGCKCRKMQDQY